MNLFDLSAEVKLNIAPVDRALTENQKKVVSLEKEYQKLDKATAKVTASTKTHADHTTNLGHAFKALTAQVVVADGPLGGIASRMRAMSSEAGELSSALGPGGAIVAGLVALAGVGLLAADALFKLAESTAKYGDSIFIAHEKTALSVGTLSALKVAGDAVNVDIASMSTGLIRFTNNLELAAAGNKKMLSDFGQLGVTAFHDNDKALSQFLTKFAALRTDQERTVAAGQVFGVRFGAALIPVLNRVGGNMEEFKAKLRSMGLLMTDEGAQDAHDFEVALEMLGMRIAGIGRTVGQETLPAFLQMFHVLDGVVDQDMENWRQWGRDLAEVIRGATAVVAGYVGAVKGFFSGGLGGALAGYIGGVTSAVHKMDDFQWGRQVAQDVKTATGPMLGPPRFHIPSTASGSHADPAIEAKHLADIRLQSVLEGFKGEEDALKRSLSIRAISLENFTKAAITLANQQHEAAMQGLADEEAEASNLRKPAVALAQIALKRDQEMRKSAESVTKYLDALTDDALSNARTREDGLLKIREISAGATADLWRRLADQRVVTEEMAVKAIGQIEMNGLKLQAIQADNELKRAGEDKAKQLAAQVQIAEIQVRIAALSVSTENAATDALRARLQLQLQFNNALGETWRNLHLQSIELDKQKVAHGVEIGAISKRKGRKDLAGLDLEAEDVQYRSAQAALAAKLIADQEKASLDQRNRLYEAFLAQRDLLDKQHAENQKEILDRPLVAFQQKMERLASGVTNALDRAITDGFDHGIKVGLKSFEIGILEMIKSAALAALEARLAKIFGKLLGGGSDSNDDEGDSGGSSNSGLGSIFSVFKNLFKPHAMGLNYVPYDGYLASLHRGEAVVPASQNKPGGAGGHTFVVNINVPDIHSAGSRQTQYQVAKAIQGHLAKAVLVG